MRNIYSTVLALLILCLALNTFSQDWNWRDAQVSSLDPISLNSIDYGRFVFDNKVDFRKTIFKSDASFFKAKFDSTASFVKARFDSTTYFKIAEFGSKADFSEALFHSIANFNGTRFNSIAHFNSAHFDSIANFYGANFNSDAEFLGASFDSTNFQEAIFYSAAHFSQSHFFRTAFFYETQFYSAADFSFTRFDSTALFYVTQFYSNAYFNYVRFASVANFSEARFDSTVNFDEARFTSAASFSEAQFDKKADFTKAQFHGEVDLNGAILPEYLNFSQVTKIASEIDLTKSRINPEYGVCHINLSDAAIDKFRFRYKRFKIWFPPEDSIGYDLKANVYEELLLKQQAEGFTQSYEKLDKEYREFQYTDPGAGRGAWGQLLNWVDKNWWGYGYDKELIIRNVLVIFLIVSLLNSFFLKYLISNVYSNEKIERLLTSKSNKNRLTRWFDSLRYSIFYSAIIFFSFHFDMDKLNYAGNLDGWRILNLTYFMVIYLGGVVCMAYLANYIITV